MKHKQLTAQESRVIEKKGTEKPFSGKYDNFYENGVYICRRCEQPLYRSADKFDAGCGWPSFDQEIKGSVTRQKDADGIRTEISCSNCNAHLGHVFSGEGHTAKNTRHCVNSISMTFIPFDFKPGQEHETVLGCGCFWCSEAVFKMMDGVKSVIPGYAGGQTLNPNYEAVSSGATGHAEVVKVVFDPQKISFRDILKIFFKSHDPTTANRQENDLGEQYRSIILYKTLQQKKETADFIKKLAQEKIYKDPIVTEIKPLTGFHKAEKEHLDYYAKNSGNSYCRLVIKPKLDKIFKLK